MNMKRFFLAALCVAAMAVTAAETAPEPENSNLENMGRGVVNIVTCALEIPRCMVYRNSEMPFWGLIAGAVDGTGCTVMRAVTGVTDILFPPLCVGFPLAPSESQRRR